MGRPPHLHGHWLDGPESSRQRCRALSDCRPSKFVKRSPGTSSAALRGRDVNPLPLEGCLPSEQIESRIPWLSEPYRLSKRLAGGNRRSARCPLHGSRRPKNTSSNDETQQRLGTRNGARDDESAKERLQTGELGAAPRCQKLARGYATPSRYRSDRQTSCVGCAFMLALALPGSPCRSPRRNRNLAEHSAMRRLVSKAARRLSWARRRPCSICALRPGSSVVLLPMSVVSIFFVLTLEQAVPFRWFFRVGPSLSAASAPIRTSRLNLSKKRS